jgi:anti-anti-sigma regulatory factor
MFRLHRVFENDQTILLKLEGKITDENLSEWTDWLASITRDASRQIILDGCDLDFISTKAVEKLVGQITPNLFLLNCPTAIKNMVHIAGLSKNVLE